MFCAQLHTDTDEENTAEPAPEHEEISNQVLAAVAAAIAADSELNTPLQPEVLAAVSAAIAEGLTRDVTGIRIISMKRI